MATHRREYHQHLLSLSEKMFLPLGPAFPKKKQRLHGDRELALTAVESHYDAHYRQKILKWIREMSVAERLSVCREENSWLSGVLREMLYMKSVAGEGVFSLLQDRSRESDEVEGTFAFRKVDAEHGLALRLGDTLQLQRRLEVSLRFCDSRSYLDTLTLPPAVLADAEQFISLMQSASDGRAFATPCRARWDSSAKAWLWELPPWCSGQHSAVCVWALAVLERRVWARYWEKHRQDPRAAGESQPFTWECRCEVRDSLLDCWLSLPIEKQQEIVLCLAPLFTQEKQNWQRNYRPKKYCYPPPLCVQANAWCGGGPFTSPAGTYYSYFRARMQCCQNEKSLESITVAFQTLTKTEFLDFLLYSDVVRAESILDRVARAVAMRIKSVQEKKYAEDLIKSAVSVPSKPAPKKPKPKGKAKSPKGNADNSEAGAIASPPPSATEAEKAVLTVAIENCAKPAENDDFQLVETPSRKKIAKNPQIAKVSEGAKRKNARKKHAKTERKAAVQQRAPSLDIKVVYNESKPAVISSDLVAAEFPPLSKSPAKVSKFPRVTEELEAFEQRNSAEMEARTETRVRVLGAISEVVRLLFPGAEATLFGSYSTGLALPGSDLDVAIRGTSFLLREEIQSAVKALSAYLQFQQWTLSTTPICTATVPLVKLQVLPAFFNSAETAPIKVDLTFESPTNPGHMGLASADFVRKWVLEHPHGKSVALLLKQALAAHDLNSAYLGGISSYALIVWLVAYVKKHGSMQSGDLLMGFLKFFAEDFDARKTGIDLLKPDPPATPVETSDPVFPSYNITKRLWKLSQIQRLFGLAHESLSTPQGQSLHALLSLRLDKSI